MLFSEIYYSGVVFFDVIKTEQRWIIVLNNCSYNIRYTILYFNLHTRNKLADHMILESTLVLYTILYYNLQTRNKTSRSYSF